ncbi:linear amide C-N hydrolase [Mycobacterium yunnanensis]|uniref:Linear amide C-N hydrolase n=1 Tax=Mycobacterium yunnanensis TaxID=368477 RepID=A0A9X2YXW8_9MYCO|nr:linear amide C-N hydrolase [Mycobacterium yunnanensis]MCV7420610.1 linear amide C-N hydrolase [Mycobacterium yunnanensis]
MCTRVLWNDNELAVLAGRTMDWPESTQPLLVAFPAGRERDGGQLGPATLVADNPLRWTTRYATIVATVYGLGGIDGFNERGLAAHGLYLESTDYGPRDPAKPGVHAALWAQYLLDQAADVSEAIALMDDVNVVMAAAHGFDATIHLALEDASGDSAIIEFSHGQPVIHHGRQYTVMTNDPTYDEQLQLLAAQDFSHPGDSMPLAGNASAIDRFQRASYFSSMLPKPQNQRQAVASVMAVMRNVSVPFGAPDDKFGIYDTEYRSISDLTERIYFFELTTSPSIVWVRFDDLDLVAGGPALAVNPYDETLIGDITDRFAAADIAF